MTTTQRTETIAEARVLDIVRDRPSLTAYLIAQRTGWTTGYTEEVLGRLQTRGQVVTHPKTSPINGATVQGWWPVAEGGGA